MTRFVDFATERRPLGRCVVLPGRQYSPDGPLLFFAAQTALMRGWDVRQVWWQAPDRGSRSLADETTWVAEQLAAAVEDYSGRVLVVAKSLGTLAAACAATRRYEAAWLTPLLTEPDAARPLLSYPTSQFSVIGSEDPFFDPDLFAMLPGDRLVVAGDHVLRVPGKPAAMVASHDQFIRAFDDWMERLST